MVANPNQQASAVKVQIPVDFVDRVSSNPVRLAAFQNDRNAAAQVPVFPAARMVNPTQLPGFKNARDAAAQVQTATGTGSVLVASHSQASRSLPHPRRAPVI